MSEPFQIEIPTFDEDEDIGSLATPVPHGHTRPFFDPDSPTVPQHDDSPGGASNGGRPYYAKSHNRGGSSASESSSYSVYRPPPKLGSSGHASSPSVATTSTAPAKKSSFASLKAAMRSVRAFAESTERVPPVPPLDTNYPALKNPFAKPSTPSRSQSPALSVKGKKRPAAPRSRPSQSNTSAAATSHSRDQSNPTPPANWKLTHTPVGSWAYESDFSDLLTQSPEEVPPVPRIPRQHDNRHHTNSSSVLGDVDFEARTPSEYALRVVFTRFVAHVDEKIKVVLSTSLDNEPNVTAVFGPDVDPVLESLLNDLGHIAQRHSNSVVDAVMRWKKGQNGPVEPLLVKRATTASKSRTMQEATTILNMRKGLASIYVLTRSLLVLIRSVGKDGIAEALASHLDSTFFEQYRKLDPRVVAQSANWKATATLYAQLLGAMADNRFMSITDHFLDALSIFGKEQLSTQTELRYAHLVQGMRYIKIKVWPPEAFEEGAEFMESLAGHFANTHGFMMKSSIAEALTQLLHPIRKTAQAEVNNPIWGKAMQSIYPRAVSMMVKPRYWNTAFPLAVTSLCVSPIDFFLKHWMTCFEFSVAKLKDKVSRPFALNGISRLLWTYLYRCNEPGTTAVKTLEGCIKTIFPPNRSAQHFPDEPLDTLVYILLVACSRHFDYGRDLILEFMNEQQITTTAANAQGTSVTSLLAPERMTVALRAAICTLRCLDSDKTPSWPESTDFSLPVTCDDLPAWNGCLSDATLNKPGVRPFTERLAVLATKVLAICERLVGEMYVSDDAFSPSSQPPSPEDRESLIVCQNGTRTVAYRRDLVPYMDLLQACFDSWPTCWNRSVRLSPALDVLVAGVAHVNPSVGQAAVNALQRFATGIGDETVVLVQLGRLLFSTDAITKVDVAFEPMCEHLPMIDLWSTMIEEWTDRQRLTLSPERPVEEVYTSSQLNIIYQLIEETEAAGLFLLCSTRLPLRQMGVRALRAVGSLPDSFQPEQANRTRRPFRLIAALEGTIGQAEYEAECSRNLGVDDEARLKKWTDGAGGRSLLRLVEADNTDRFLWRMVFPPFLRICLNYRPRAMAAFRSSLAAAVSRIHPVISNVAGISSKPFLQGRLPLGLSDATQLAVQWVSWVLALAATALPSEPTPAPKEHGRHGSDPIPQQERILTHRGLIRLILPYLDADVRAVREGMVYALGCAHPKALKAVLEDTQSIVRHVHDEARAALSQRRAMRRSHDQDRLYTSVMHVYQLTADLPKRLDDAVDVVKVMLSFFEGSLCFFRDAVTRKDRELIPLRKHFCGFVTLLMDTLNTINKPFTPNNDALMRTYNFCDEWCEYSFPLTDQNGPFLRAAADAASRAMASLCEYPSMFSTNPTASRSNSEQPVTYPRLLQWIDTMLGADSFTARSSGRKALTTICEHQLSEESLSAHLSGFCRFVGRSAIISAIFFETLKKSALAHKNEFPACRAIFLCLSHLIHPSTQVRQESLHWLTSLISTDSNRDPFGRLRSFVESSSEGLNMRAQRQAAEIIASACKDMAAEFLHECATRLSEGYDGTASPLKILLPWLRAIDLVPTGDDQDQGQKCRSFVDLLSITSAYVEHYPDEVRQLWQNLVCGQHLDNYKGLIKLSVVHALRCGREDFVRLAQLAISSISGSAIALDAFNTLCDCISTHTASFNDEVMQASELDALFPPTNEKSPFTYGQIACLLLADLAVDDVMDVLPRLPVLLHALLLFMDHDRPFVRGECQTSLLRIVRLWIHRTVAGQDLYASDSLLVSITKHLRLEPEVIDRAPDTSFSDIEPAPARPRVDEVCVDILEAFEPTYNSLRQHWSELALQWAASTPSRQEAIRSLHVFRAMTPMITPNSIALLLGRLSNTVSDGSDRFQAVACEILLCAVTLSRTLSPQTLHEYPQLWWGGMACLQSTVKQEYSYGIAMLESLLGMIEPAHPDILSVWQSSLPRNWLGQEPRIVPLLMPGLRSSFTSEATFNLLQRTVQFSSTQALLDDEDLPRIIVVSMPRFLVHMDEKGHTDDDFKQYTSDLGVFAEQAGWLSMARIMLSLTKDRFRNREDFIRQVIGCLGERIPKQGWLETVTLLLGLVLNSQRHLRINTMLVIKALLSTPDIRSHLREMASEHLTPLLRLLNTDLASQALNILEEPLNLTTEVPTKQVVRMSLVHGPNVRPQELRSLGVDIGALDASGWSIPKQDEARTWCRANMSAVYDTCSEASRVASTAITSGVFISEDPDSPLVHRSTRSGEFDGEEADSLYDLVSTLHDLSNYFDDVDQSTPYASSSSMASLRDAERRVAAILSRSFSKPVSPQNGSSTNGLLSPYSMDPPTPFLGLFGETSSGTNGAGAESYTNEMFNDSDDEEAYDMLSVPARFRSGAPTEDDTISESDDGASGVFELDRQSLDLYNHSMAASYSPQRPRVMTQTSQY